MKNRPNQARIEFAQAIGRIERQFRTAIDRGETWIETKCTIEQADAALAQIKIHYPTASYIASGDMFIFEVE